MYLQKIVKHSRLTNAIKCSIYAIGGPRRAGAALAEHLREQAQPRPRPPGRAPFSWIPPGFLRGPLRGSGVSPGVLRGFSWDSPGIPRGFPRDSPGFRGTLPLTAPVRGDDGRPARRRRPPVIARRPGAGAARLPLLPDARWDLSQELQNAPR
eukprot:gene15773-biopygen9701